MTDIDLKTTLEMAHQAILTRSSTAPPDFQRLAQWTRQVNVVNGWRPEHTPEQAFAELPELLALVHSEITEAFQEHTTFAQALELADVIIRALDICELLAPGRLPYFDPEYRVPVNVPWPEALLQLHAYTSAALEAYRKIDDPEQATLAVMSSMRDLFASAYDLSAEYGHNSRLLIVSKLLKNLERGYRHGGRRA